jgi:hypothetical protein
MQQIKSVLRSVRRRLDRNPRLLLHSSHAAWVKASRKYPSRKINQNQSVISKLENGLVDGISIHKNLISYPLSKERYDQGEYLGGLINSNTYELVKEAIHSGSQLYGGEHLCQKLPSFEIQSDIKKDLSQVPEIEAIVLFGGILFNHFGHFLLESLGRLWAYKFVKELDPYICFYAPDGIPDYLRRSNFVNQIMTGFGIPHDRLIFINSLVKLKEVIVPCQKYGWGIFKKPDSVFLDFVKSFSFKNDVPKEFTDVDKIYVSRTRLPFKSGMNTHGRMIAERLFEEYLTANGYQVLYPERYHLFQQLSIYNNAKKIIFSSGSALHACILLPDLRADVAIIARWQDPKDNLFHTEQFQGYGKSVLGIDALRGQYQLGLEHWDALSDVDWYKASLLLKEQGFVNTDFSSFNHLDPRHLIRSELENYIQEVLHDHRFTDFMMQLKE